jgi:hypothetical protein
MKNHKYQGVENGAIAASETESTTALVCIKGEPAAEIRILAATLPGLLYGRN